MKWFIKCLGRDYANFDARARRKEYWYFVLFSYVALLLAKLLDAILFSDNFTPITGLLSFYMIVPQLAVLVRRLHDTGRRGAVAIWCYALSFAWAISMGIVAIMVGNTPVASAPAGFFIYLFGGLAIFLVWHIVLLVWCCMPGQRGENKYGPDPKATAE